MNRWMKSQGADRRPGLVDGGAPCTLRVSTKPHGMIGQNRLTLISVRSSLPLSYRRCRRTGNSCGLLLPSRRFHGVLVRGRNAGAPGREQTMQ